MAPAPSTASALATPATTDMATPDARNDAGTHTARPTDASVATTVAPASPIASNACARNHTGGKSARKKKPSADSDSTNPTNPSIHEPLPTVETMEVLSATLPTSLSERAQKKLRQAEKKAALDERLRQSRLHAPHKATFRFVLAQLLKKTAEAAELKLRQEAEAAELKLRQEAENAEMLRLAKEQIEKNLLKSISIRVAIQFERGRGGSTSSMARAAAPTTLGPFQGVGIQGTPNDKVVHLINTRGWEQMRNTNHAMYHRRVTLKIGNETVEDVQTILLSKTPSDFRARKKALCQLRKFERNVVTVHM